MWGSAIPAIGRPGRKGTKVSLVLSAQPWEAGHQLLPLCPSFQERGGCGESAVDSRGRCFRLSGSVNVRE